MIFKGVRDGRPYPDHGLSHRQWAQIPPRQIRLDELVTTTTVLALDRLLSEDSTFYGDLFCHAVKWKGIVYLEDGLHRAVRAALRNRIVLHARVFDMDAAAGPAGVDVASARRVGFRRDDSGYPQCTACDCGERLREPMRCLIVDDNTTFLTAALRALDSTMWTWSVSHRILLRRFDPPTSRAGSTCA